MRKCGETLFSHTKNCCSKIFQLRSIASYAFRQAKFFIREIEENEEIMLTEWTMRDWQKLEFKTLTHQDHFGVVESYESWTSRSQDLIRREELEE